MRRTLGFPARILTVVVAAMLGLLLCEGAYSLWTGGSILNRLGGLEPPPRIDMLDEERLALAAKTEGVFAVATDPEVGFNLKGRMEREVFLTTIRTDDWGQRIRVGPEPETDAPRIVILGDSFAFGFGVEDNETLAFRLEELLSATLEPGAPRPVVFAVACPGWTGHNASRFLRNHLARIDPDVVLFLSVANDIHDSFATTEVGHRSLVYDPAVGGTRPHVSVEAFVAFLPVLLPRVSPELRLDLLAAGGLEAIPHTVLTGITPESNRRWNALIEDIRDLKDRLARRDGHLAVTSFWNGAYELQLAYRLAEAIPDLAVLPPFRGPEAGDTLEGDGHPSPRALRAAAWCMAELLIERGWVPGVGSEPLPPLEGRYAERRTELRSREEGIAWLRERQTTWKRFMGPEIDLDRTFGFQQIYGGVAPDGTVGRGMFCALQNSGGATRLTLWLERLPVDSGLYPLSLQIDVGMGDPVSVAVPEPDLGEGVIVELHATLPDEVRDQPWIDLHVRASNWIIEQAQGIRRLAAFRLKRLLLHDGE